MHRPITLVQVRSRPQTEVCVAIIEGDSPWARNNTVLGQFDLLGIPPAPAGMPQIEITFRVDEDSKLHVQAM